MNCLHTQLVRVVVDVDQIERVAVGTRMIEITDKNTITYIRWTVFMCN